jgi:hypothetical protein
MTQIHGTAIIVAIITLLMSSFGFLRKKLNIRVTYVFIWFSISLFVFGILPLSYPDWSFSKQISRVLLSAVTGFIVVGLMLEYIVAKRGANE